MKDYYTILGIRPNASAVEIELAYKGRRTQYHPDKYSNSDAETIRWATINMQEVNEAYAALSNASDRSKYDAGQNHPHTNDGDVYQRVLATVREHDIGSISLIQRKLKLEYKHVVRLFDQMEKDGILGPMGGNGQRAVLKRS